MRKRWKVLLTFASVVGYAIIRKRTKEQAALKIFRQQIECAEIGVSGDLILVRFESNRNKTVSVFYYIERRNSEELVLLRAPWQRTVPSELIIKESIRALFDEGACFIEKDSQEALTFRHKNSGQAAS